MSYSWQEITKYYIDLDEKEFKEAQNDNEPALNDPLLSNYIYLYRAEKLFSRDLFGFKSKFPDLTWKDYYNRLVFLKNNINKPWLINFYMKAGNLMELELLEKINPNLATSQPTQTDIDDAAKNNRLAVLEYYAPNLLPSMKVAEEISRSGNINILDFLKNNGKVPSFSYIYQAIINRNLPFIRWYQDNVPIKRINVYESLGSLPNFQQLYIEIARRNDIELWDLAANFFSMPIDWLLEIITLGLIENNQNILKFAADQLDGNKTSTIVTNMERIDLSYKVIRIILDHLKDKSAEVLNLFYSRGLLPVLTDDLLDYIIDNNMFNILAWFYLKGQKSTYLEKNFAKWKKQRRFSVDMETIIKSLLDGTFIQKFNSSEIKTSK